MPAARSWLVWSICKIEFFFTTANSTSMPSSENRFNDWLNKIRATPAQTGSVSGNDSKIVIGCSHDSNWAAMHR